MNKLFWQMINHPYLPSMMLRFYTDYVKSEKLTLSKDDVFRFNMHALTENLFDSVDYSTKMSLEERKNLKSIIDQIIKKKSITSVLELENVINELNNNGRIT